MNEPLLLPPPKNDRVTLDEFMHGAGTSGKGITVKSKNIDSIYRTLEKVNLHNEGMVDLCTVFVRTSPGMPPTPMKIVVTQEIAHELASGRQTVDVLDSMFLSLLPEIRVAVKEAVRHYIVSTIAKYKL